MVDIVITSNLVISNEYDEMVDMNDDGMLNVLDIVILVNLILEDN